MNVEGEESYLNFYIALDALYGVRGSVEASISAGIAGLHGPPEWSEKAGRLFDLRNEIVHGGSRHIAEWPDYARYRRHFGTRPESDMKRIAFAALMRITRTFG
jgi:hypothetical protein